MAIESISLRLGRENLFDKYLFWISLIMPQLVLRCLAISKMVIKRDSSMTYRSKAFVKVRRFSAKDILTCRMASHTRHMILGTSSSMNTCFEPMGIDRNCLNFLPLKINRFDWQFGQQISNRS